MSDLKATVHQNRFRLGVCPRPHRGNLHRSPDSLAGFKGPTTKRRGGKGRRGEENGGEGRKGTTAVRWYGAPEW